MSDPVTFGIVGCGEITSKRRAEMFDETAGAEIGIAMDIVEELARDIGTRFDVPWTTEFDDVLENTAIDAVYLAVPHDLHAPQAIRAAQAGKHVLVEKPIATSIAEADEMIETCQREDVALGVFLHRSFSETQERARKLLNEGLIGEIVGAEIEIMVDKDDSYWEGGYTGRVETDWRKKKERSGGGVLSINGTHNIDALRQLTGLECERVYAEYDTFATDVEVEDFISATLRYDNGAIGTIHASSIAQRDPPDAKLRADRVYGTEGTLLVSNPIRLRTTRSTEYGEAGEWTEVDVPVNNSDSDPLIGDFVDAVRSGREPRISGVDGLKALEVIEGAYRSGKRQQMVELPVER